MSFDDLIERTRRSAEDAHARGVTSAELYARADEQDRTGFSVSAPFTRLLASAVKILEARKLGAEMRAKLDAAGVKNVAELIMKEKKEGKR
jgi:hypothetical protein